MVAGLHILLIQLQVNVGLYFSLLLNMCLCNMLFMFSIKLPQVINSGIK